MFGEILRFAHVLYFFDFSEQLQTRDPSQSIELAISPPKAKKLLNSVGSCWITIGKTNFFLEFLQKLTLAWSVVSQSRSSGPTGVTTDLGPHREVLASLAAGASRPETKKKSARTV